MFLQKYLHRGYYQITNLDSEIIPVSLNTEEQSCAREEYRLVPWSQRIIFFFLGLLPALLLSIWVQVNMHSAIGTSSSLLKSPVPESKIAHILARHLDC